MKKLMVIAAAAICAGMTFGDDAIASANVVRYTTQTLTAGYLNLIAAQFDKAGTTERPALNDGFIQGEITGSDYDADSADNILIFMPEMGGYHSDYTFYFLDSPGDDNDQKWVDLTNDAYVDYTIPADKAFFYWVRADHDITLTFAGAVKATAVDVVAKAGWLNMCANPYPQAIDINGVNGGLTFDWVALGATGTDYDADNADNIMLYVPTEGGYHSDYTFYFLDSEGDDNDKKWVDLTNDAATDKQIPVGAGFWYWRRGETDLTLPFSSPVAP